MSRNTRSRANGYPVMHFPNSVEQVVLSDGYSAEKMEKFLSNGRWGIGGYLEKRSGMYTAPQYDNKRNIHMGVDIWAPEKEPIFSPVPGKIIYKAFHDQPGNYGGTVVLKHLADGTPLFALYGHLSKQSVDGAVIGRKLEAGEKFAELGRRQENGEWPPHLHLQLSIDDPGEADMPGVVADGQLEDAKVYYPNPKIIIGDWYE